MIQDIVVDWEALLDQSGVWDHMFQSEDGDINSIRKSQMPGATSNPAHWSRFSSFEKMPIMEESEEEEDVNGPKT